MNRPIRVGLIDSHEIVRDSLKVFLETLSDFVCVGEAGSPPEALALCRRAKPDIVMLDFLQPPGTALIRQLQEQFPNLRILVLTTVSDRQSLFAAIQAGAKGYLLKQASIDELAEALQAVYAGIQVIDPELQTLWAVAAT